MDEKVEQFLSAVEEESIVNAIRIAEEKTSGEIRVHIEAHFSGEDPYKRAQEVFHLLKMDNTKLENGVLFYVAVKDKKFCILGDRGINEAVGSQFWNEVKGIMGSRFRESEYSKGLVEGIQLAGEKLAHFFPWDTDDTNELTNQISKG
jgi:uncharacterized membrane protein